MVFTRTVRDGGSTSLSERVFPVFRPDPGDPGEIVREREKLALLIAYEKDLAVLRAEVEAYYAGKTNLEDILMVMMSSMLCTHVNQLKAY